MFPLLPISQGISHDVSGQEATLLLHEQSEEHGRREKLAFEWSHVVYFPNLLLQSVLEQASVEGKKQ